MTNELENLNEIKKKLFGDLEVKIIRDLKDPNKIIFKRKIDFGKNRLYIKYSLKENKINQIYQNRPKNKKRILYNEYQSPQRNNLKNDK